MKRSASRVGLIGFRSGLLLLLLLLGLLPGTSTAQMATPFPMPDHGADWWHLVMVDQLEYRAGGGQDALAWDGFGWVGGDWYRLWVRSEGEHVVANSATHIETQLLASRLVAPFWEAQVGLRHDHVDDAGPDRDRVRGVISLQGLAPYRFEASAALFIDDDADLGLRLVAEREWWITQQLAFEGRTEFEAATHRDNRLGEVSGVQLVELSLRLRFYFHREFAPYLGISWETHREQEASGFRQRETGAQVVGGVSVWF